MEHFVESIDRVGGSLRCVRMYVQTRCHGIVHPLQEPSRSSSLIANRTKQQPGRDSDANISRVMYICGFEFCACAVGKGDDLEKARMGREIM